MNEFGWELVNTSVIESFILWTVSFTLSFDMSVLAEPPHTGGLLMFVQIALEGKGLATPSAGIGLLCGVRLHVRPQVGLVSEGLGTLWTFEGLLPRVGANVSLQQPRPAEPLATVLALAALVVGTHVHAIGRH